MLIPKRYTPKPKEEPKPQEVKVVERVESKADTQAIMSEIKKMMPKQKKAPKYVFSILRDEEGRMTEVVATPVDYDTIV